MISTLMALLHRSSELYIGALWHQAFHHLRNGQYRQLNNSFNIFQRVAAPHLHFDSVCKLCSWDDEKKSAIGQHLHPNLKCRRLVPAPVRILLLTSRIGWVALNLGMYALAIKPHEEVIVKPFEIARLSWPGSQYSNRIPDSHARHPKMKGASAITMIGIPQSPREA
jgi:hypothetical protein